MLSRRMRFMMVISGPLAVWLAMLLFGGRHSSWDVDLYRFLYVGGNAVLTRNSATFTQLGSGMVLVPLAIVAAIFLVLRRKRRAALFLFMVFAGRLLVELQKVIFDRPRPGISPSLVAVDSFSFPSGHAANAMITYLAIGLLLPVRQRNRAIILGIGLALALQVGVSRVMLGAHWSSDVIGGWAFAIVWIMLCMRLANARPDAEARLDED